MIWDQTGMAPICVSLLWCVLVLVLDCPARGAPGRVFLSGPAADGVLRRQRRHNTGLFEEFLAGNLERECLEERCDLEEAREAFENDEKTMEFWVGYVDGDQCKSGPCQNKGECKDQRGSHTCSCLPGFTGRNCEIVTARQCEVNNGGCMHFCMSMGAFGAQCTCTEGYRLAQDGMSCDPEGEFSCGRDLRTVVTDDSWSRSLLNSSAPMNLTTSANATAPAPSPSAAPFPSPSVAPDPSPSLPAQTEASVDVTLLPPPAIDSGLGRSWDGLHSWVYGPTEPLPTRPRPTEPLPTKPRPTETLFEGDPGARTRIVGGNEVAPGEIPWQVALVMRPSEQVFCGGSILSELWVITAAHCLDGQEGSFFIRAGEHDIYRKEGTEQDREVAQRYPHPFYDARRSAYNHDIALLRLHTPLSFSPSVRPICLGPKAFTESLVKEASPATVSGWGRTRFQGATASVLRRVVVPFTDKMACKDSSSARVTRYMFCAGYYEQEKDACQGDSGGPHANRRHGAWFLTGIVSWGEECAQEGKYGVYTRVSHYYRWIRHVTGATNDGPQEDIDP